LGTVAKAILITAAALGATGLFAQPPGRGGGPQSETVRQGQALLRQGKINEALAMFRQELDKTPDSPAANNAAGTALDLLGRGSEAKRYFAKAIESAPSPQAKAQAQRAMAMSYAFDRDSKNAVKYEQLVIAYWATREQAEPQNAFYQHDAA